MKLSKLLLLSASLIGMVACSPSGTIGGLINGGGFNGGGAGGSNNEPSGPNNPTINNDTDSSWISNIPSQGNGNPAMTGGVNKITWDAIFDLLSMGQYSNLRIRASNGHDWEASIYFDSGKILFTGLGMKSQQEGSIQNVYKDYAYLHIKNVSNGEVDYDYYDFCNVWMVESESDEVEEFIEDFFEDFGIYHLSYNNFTYDPNSGTYLGSMYINSTLYVRVTLNNNRISSIVYTNDYGYSYYYYYEQYGQVSVTLPTPGSSY